MDRNAPKMDFKKLAQIRPKIASKSAPEKWTRWIDPKIDPKNNGSKMNLKWTRKWTKNGPTHIHLILINFYSKFKWFYFIFFLKQMLENSLERVFWLCDS